MAKLTTDTIGSEKIDIFVDTSGQFSAEFNGERYQAESRVKLHTQLEAAVKRKQSERAIPITFVDSVFSRTGSDKLESGRGVVHAKLRGKHGREHNTFLYITEEDKPQRFKFGGYYSRNRVLCRRLTDEEIAEYGRLVAAVDAAQEAYDAWRKEREIDPQDTLDAKPTNTAK